MTPLQVDISNGFEIASFHYEVVLDGKGLKGRQHWGESSSIEQEVTIESESSTERFRDVFCHEVLEAINSALSLDLEHNDIVRIATGYAQVLKSLGVEFVYGKRRLKGIVLEDNAE